ncbi:MAG TPA: AraC family transcriptional regulator [Mobilitalea sp.]|nr:AraC family transcriptional regulator [Mobilitalea sp.]
MKTQPYITRQNMLASDYEIFYYSDRCLDMVNLHHHDFYECYLFLSGDVTYYVEGKVYPLLPGDIILINTKELHQPIINNKELPYDRIVLWLNKAFIRSLSTENIDLANCFEDTEKDNVLRADIEIQQNIKIILNKLLNLSSYKGIGKELLYKGYITELLIVLNNILFLNYEKTDIETDNSNLIDNVIHYINNHLEEVIRIEDLSNHFFISKFHLLRKFKKQSGTTLHKFIIQKKFIYAKELIITGMPINQVHERCGFGDYSNFFRAFKNEYGMTPKQFYEMMKRQGIE